MKVKIVNLLFFYLPIASYAGGGGVRKPSFTVELKDGTTDLPSFSLEHSHCGGENDNEDVTVGCEYKFGPSCLSPLPKSVWGRYSRKGKFDTWLLDVRVDAEVDTLLENVDVEVNAVNNPVDLSCTLLATSGKGGSLNSIDVCKGYPLGSGNLYISPSWDYKDSSGSLRVEHITDDGTSMEWLSSAEESRVTYSRSIGNHRISPSITTDGNVSLEVDLETSADSSLSWYVCKDEVEVEWSDREWTATFAIPLEGKTIAGTNVHIKREIQF